MLQPGTSRGKMSIVYSTEVSCSRAVDAVSNFCLEQKSEGKYQLKRGHRHYYQCHLQIFVTKCNFCDLVVWTTDELHVVRLTLDDTLITSALPSTCRVIL